jgi:predicted acetyltransferase
MWRYIFGVDLIKRITTRSGAVDEPLMLMLAEPRRVNLHVRDGMWLRLVDVPAALSGRAYAADDSIVIEVTDEFIPDAGGRWRLTTAAGEGAVEPSSDPADLVLHTNDLASAYLGGFTFGALARAGRGTEFTPGARARADAMFASREPAWCPQIF